ncbi:MAG: phage shock protein PspA [Deltaproteobacteria bacterium]|nr:phage shock protein PspA [Deltaproteobacteria bacterium]
MGIFTRFRDIISSNINAMLDRAEDPEKLIRMMIREMEDTLVEIKVSCAGLMATVKRVRRQMEEQDARVRFWDEKAGLAVSKGRDDLAREALVEKRRYQERARALDRELLEHNALVEQYQDDMRQLEEKLAMARERERILTQRHVHAQRKRQAQEEIRRADSTEAIIKFEELEDRIDRMESEAELVNFGKKRSLEAEFERLQVDEEIERELQGLKANLGSRKQGETAIP